MKKFVIALIVTATSAIAFAQAPGTGHHGHRAGLQELGAKLNLTDAQKQQLKDLRASDREQNKQLYADFHAKLQELRTLKQAGDPRADEVKAQLKAMRPEIQAARKASRQAMLNVLTPDQRAQLKAARQAHGHGQARLMRHALAQKLNLTDEQKAQIKQLHETAKSANAQLFADVRTKRQELRALTRANDPRASDVKAELQALRPQIKAARQQERDAFLNILTPDQRTQLEQLKNARRARRAS